MHEMVERTLPSHLTPRPEAVPDPQQTPEDFSIKDCPQYSEDARAKILRLSVRRIKKGFQSVQTANREERYSQLLTQEVKGVFTLLTDLGMVDDTDESYTVVDQMYRYVGQHIDAVDRDIISDLDVKYTGHPVLQGLAMLPEVLMDKYPENLVHMRRNVLIMMDGTQR